MCPPENILYSELDSGSLFASVTINRLIMHAPLPWLLRKPTMRKPIVLFKYLSYFKLFYSFLAASMQMSASIHSVSTQRTVWKLPL